VVVKVAARARRKVGVVNMLDGWCCGWLGRMVYRRSDGMGEAGKMELVLPWYVEGMKWMMVCKWSSYSLYLYILIQFKCSTIN